MQKQRSATPFDGVVNDAETETNDLGVPDISKALSDAEVALAQEVTPKTRRIETCCGWIEIDDDE